MYSWDWSAWLVSAPPFPTIAWMFVYYFFGGHRGHCDVLFGPLMAWIALAISSSFIGFPHARPTFENAILHSSSPELLLPAAISVHGEQVLRTRTGEGPTTYWWVLMTLRLLGVGDGGTHFRSLVRGQYELL